MKHKILLSLVAVLLTTALSAQDYDFQSGDLYYNFTSDNTVEVTYQEYLSSTNYQGLSTPIIPETVTYNGTTYSVTSIGEVAFFGCSSLTSVTIPNSVTSIGSSAFYDCSGLTSITIPNSVTSIGSSAFLGCSSLTSITIPNSVTSIGEGAFVGCSSITSIIVGSGNTMYDSRENCNAIIETASNTLIAGCQSTTIPNSVTSIGNGAFGGCSSLTSITIPNSVTSIGNSAFIGCSSITSVTIPNSVTSIGQGTFGGCSSLTSVTIPNSVTSIGDYAFQRCSSLTSITIPNSVTSIGESAFEDCSGLTSITIPNSVTSIGNSAFSGTPWLTNQPDGVVYLGAVLYLYKGSMPQNTSVIVNSGTKAISSGAFSFCSGLTSITIPNSVTSIGMYAFYYCSGLTSITIPNSVTSIGIFAFGGCSSLTSITIPNSVTSIEYSAFWGCSSLTSITLPNSVTSIGDVTFEGCSSLTSVTIPNSVTSIGVGAFGDCSSLTSVTIPNSVTSIGSGAFSNCVQLTSITCEANTPPSCDISMDGNSFYNIPFNCTIKVPCGCLEAYNTAPWNNYQLAIIPPPSLQVQPSSESFGSTIIDQEVDCDSTAIVSATANYGYHFVQWSDSITDNPRTIKLTKDTLLTAVFAQSFAGQCGDSLYWSYDTTTISITGSGAMYNYSDSLMPWYLFRDSITAVEMVNTATTIGDNAFANCSKLSKLTISEGIESVGANAFMGCTQLTNITCHPIIPPYAVTSSFENYDTYLRVPCSSKSQYMADAVWGQFKYIECIEEETDIESVESESSEQSVRKVYRDGHIYILRDDEEYSILGQKL